MKRYQKANEGVHAPEKVKEKAVRPGGQRSRARWAGPVAAVLAVVIIGGIALWTGHTGPNAPTAFAGDNPTPLPGEEILQPRAVPDFGDVEDDPVHNGGSHKALALAEAVYQLPELDVPPQPDVMDFLPEGEDTAEAWEQAHEAWEEAFGAWCRIAYPARYRLEENETIGGFITASTTQFLTGAGDDNRVYSPLNLYMALAMLAETAGGESRRQILDVLGADSIEALREDAAAVWQNYYQDDDMGISVMANSLWLRDGMSYSQDTLETLAANYYASSFAGKMGSEEYNQALRDWVNQQTRGVLTGPVDGLFFDPETVLGLVSTLYFKSAWSDPFNLELNTRDVFHSPSGDVDAEFLHSGDWFHGTYYWGEHFSAINLGFQSSYRNTMWLILPDEGYTVEGLLESGEAMEFLLAGKSGTYDEETGEETGGWPNQKYLMINLSLPKFDVSSNLELADGLKALGITDIFNPSVSDFTPLGASTDEPIYVSKAEHAARVTIDEEGCTAASYVELMLVAGAAPPPDEVVDFTLDRPFLFAITGTGDLPLFLGVVNQPNV